MQRILRVKKAKNQGKLDHVLNVNEGVMDKKSRIAITKDIKRSSVKKMHVADTYLIRITVLSNYCSKSLKNIGPTTSWCRTM